MPELGSKDIEKKYAHDRCVVIIYCLCSSPCNAPDYSLGAQYATLNQVTLVCFLFWFPLLV